MVCGAAKAVEPCHPAPGTGRKSPHQQGGLHSGDCMYHIVWHSAGICAGMGALAGRY